MVIKFEEGELMNFFAGLNDLRDALHRTAVEKGWWEPQRQEVFLVDGTKEMGLVQRSFGDLVSLVHSETSEALEEHRSGNGPTKVYYRYKSLPGEEPGGTVRHNDRGIWVDGVRLTPENAREFGYDAKPEGIPIEFADTIIRVLDICGFYGIDIEEALRVKAQYNATRPYRHGGKKL